MERFLTWRTGVLFLCGFERSRRLFPRCPHESNESLRASGATSHNESSQHQHGTQHDLQGS
jgi:hypothetical protein